MRTFFIKLAALAVLFFPLLYISSFLMYKLSWYPFMCNPEAVSTAGFEDLLAEQLRLDRQGAKDLKVLGYERDDAGNWPVYRIYFELGRGEKFKEFSAFANACGVNSYWVNMNIAEKR